MAKPRNPKPSPKQLETYRFLLEFIQEHAYQPSLGEIGKHFGITKTAVIGRLDELEERGFIVRVPDRDRAIELPGIKFIVHSIDKDERKPKD